MPAFLTLEDYQHRAYQFAIYPKDRALEYTALGLCNETGELHLKARELLHHPARFDWAGAFGELGDVMWYSAACYRELGLPYVIADLYNFSHNLPNLYVLNLCDDLIKYSSVYAGAVKRSLRDGLDPISNRAHFKDFLDKYNLILRELTYRFGMSLDEIAGLNLRKLSGRQERGVLGGQGDHR